MTPATEEELTELLRLVNALLDSVDHYGEEPCSYHEPLYALYEFMRPTFTVKGE